MECRAAAAEAHSPPGEIMIERILPAHVSVASRTAMVSEDQLHPEEELLVVRAVSRRRREFATGRSCARSALASLGVRDYPVTSHPGGAPRWPKGFVGSISHCDGYCASAVASEETIRTIGIDVEPNAPIKPHLVPDIALPSEAEWIAAKPAGGNRPVHRDRLLFTIKESVYKAWFPLVERWLGFEDAHVEVMGDGTEGEFIARLLVVGRSLDGEEISEFRGRWMAESGLVFSAIAEPSETRGPLASHS